MSNPRSPRLDRSDWFQLILCLSAGCGLSFSLLYVALNTLLEPKLLAETALRTSRSVRLVETSLQVLPPAKLPPGVVVITRPWGPETGPQTLGPFDQKVQELMARRYGVDRELQRDKPPFVEAWGGLWVHLESPGAPYLWLYQPERLSSSSVWFLPLLRSAALLLGLLMGMLVFINKRVEIPFRRVFTQLPDGLPAPLPLLPEEGIAPLRVLSLRINRLLERLNNAVRTALAKPDLNARLRSLGAVVVGSTPEEFRAFLVADLERWRSLITAARITAEAG